MPCDKRANCSATIRLPSSARIARHFQAKHWRFDSTEGSPSSRSFHRATALRLMSRTNWTCRQTQLKLPALIGSQIELQDLLWHCMHDACPGGWRFQSRLYPVSWKLLWPNPFWISSIQEWLRPSSEYSLSSLFHLRRTCQRVLYTHAIR